MSVENGKGGGGASTFVFAAMHRTRQAIYTNCKCGTNSSCPVVVSHTPASQKEAPPTLLPILSRRHRCSAVHVVRRYKRLPPHGVLEQIIFHPYLVVVHHHYYHHHHYSALNETNNRDGNN